MKIAASAIFVGAGTITAFPATPVPTNSTIPSTLTLSASLTPINNTHIGVSITNTYSQDISILKWHTHFHDSAEHNSFIVTHDINGSQKALRPGPSMLRFHFRGVNPEQFINITAGGTYSDEFDLTTLFAVPEDGTYNVAMDIGTRATLPQENSTLNQALESAGRWAQKLPVLEITSESVTMHLTRSRTSLQKRQSAGDCGPATSASSPGSVVSAARSNAQNLAHYAQSSTNGDLWTLYFNSSTQQSLVYNVYQGVINYGAGTNNYGVTEQCDTQNTDPGCLKNSEYIAYAQPYTDNSYDIVFCKPFFSLDAARKCDYPSYSNAGMADQGGVFLHELVHVEPLNGGAKILDGSAANPECYSWACVTGAATSQDGSQDPPWQIANAYEFYAYAARALGTESCNNNVADVTNNIGSLGGIANEGDPCANGACPHGVAGAP